MIQVFLCTENVAKGKMSYQSSVRFSGASWRGVDGNHATHYEMYNTCTHTARQLNPWWMVDLASAANVSRVEITNRDPACKSIQRGISCSEETFINQSKTMNRLLLI